MEADANLNTPDGTSVYRYYDRFGILIYVGITAQRTTRNQQHNRDKAWWPLVASQTVEHCADRASALHREAELIRRFRPPFNKAHNATARSQQQIYQAFLDSGVGDADPQAVLKACDSRPPLRWLERDRSTGTGILLFPLEFASVVPHLQLEGGIRLVVSGRGVGEVSHIDRQGPLALLYVRQINRFVDESAVVKAHIKQFLKKQRILKLQLTHVTIYQDAIPNPKKESFKARMKAL